MLNNKDRLAVRYQNDIIRIYNKAFIDAYEDLLKTKDELGNSRATTIAKANYVNQLYDDLSYMANTYSKKMPTATIEMHKEFMQMIVKEKVEDKQTGKVANFKRNTLFKEIDKNVRIANEKAVHNIIKGNIYKDGKGLSDRLWNACNSSGDKIDLAIASCMARGISSAEASKIIKEFGTGGHRTWNRKKIQEKLGPGYARAYSGGLDYEALRLMRTTHTHMSQIASIESSKINPYVGAIRWHSVHSNGRTCEQCIDRDGKVYKLGDMPFDHPNGLCWTEPVFTNAGGRILTPNQVAKDIGKWIKGEQNSGTMDKLYGDIPLDIPGKVTVVSRFKDGLQRLVDGASSHNRKQFQAYADDAVKILAERYDDVAQELYALAVENLDEWITDGDKAYFLASKKRICFSPEAELRDAKDYKKGDYDVFFHELGHAMDKLVGDLNYMGKLTVNTKYINALKEDFKNHPQIMGAIWDKQNPFDKFTAEELKDKATIQHLYNTFLLPNHKTSGIQDVVGGLSNKEYKLTWGHSKQYWNRKDRDLEVASEAWANMLGSYSDEETYQLMMTYFPRAMKEQKAMLEDALNIYNSMSDSSW